MQQTVDIVLPCYNPNGSWHMELLDFYREVKNLYDVSFILVNDGSAGSDNITAPVADLKKQAIPVRYISYSKNMGKGYALRQGVLQSKSKFIVYTDVDFPFTSQSTMDVIATLLSGKYDVVAGYRDDKYYLKSMTAYRKWLSKTFRFFIKNILKMPVTDTQCGLKGFSEKGKAKFLETTINRYLFDFEFIYSAARDKSIVMTTVQVYLKDNIVFSKMKLKILLQETFNLFYVLLIKRR